MTSATPAMFVLGLDLDGVVGAYVKAFRAFVSRALGVNPADLPEPAYWDFSQSWPGVIKDLDHYLELHEMAVSSGLFRNMELMPHASSALWSLSDADVYIRVITHRLFRNGIHAPSTTGTIEFLDRKLDDGRPAVPYRDLCFVADKPSVWADVYIDDSPTNVEKLRAAGRNVIVFDAPYNQDVEGPRAKDWHQAHDLVLDFKDKWAANQ